MAKLDRREIEQVIERLLKQFPDCREEVMLWAEGREPPWRVLIGTILSQRTRDENTAKATAKLFSKYGSIKRLANAPLKQIEKLIKISGPYHQKAHNIKKTCQILMKKYKGQVPSLYEELVMLPGVGHKTADCVLLYGYGRACIPIDTHCHKISNLLGWIKTKTHEKTREELLRIVPKRHWKVINCLFVSLGQATRYKRTLFRGYLGEKLYYKYAKKKQFLNGLKS